MKEVCERRETYLQRHGAVGTQPGQSVEWEPGEPILVHPAKDCRVFADLHKDILHAGVESRALKTSTKELGHQASIQTDDLPTTQALHQVLHHRLQREEELVAIMHGVQVGGEPRELKAQC